MFVDNDDETKAPAIRNPFWQPKPGTFKEPGLGEVQIGINEVQASGVMFCACDVALTVNSRDYGQNEPKDAAVAKKGIKEAILVYNRVPRYVAGRAQEHGCAYCFAG